MVYGFAHQSQGHVEIKSKLDQGTTIRLYLPSIENAGEEEGPAPSLANRTQAVDSNEVILVVEDEEIIRELVTEALREQGYRVLEAADGTDGLQSPARVDLVISDIGLPGLNGRQMIDAARARCDLICECYL